MNLDHLPDLLCTYEEYDKIITKISDKYDFKLQEKDT